MGTIVRRDELRGDSDRIANLANAALQHIADTELPTDITYVHLFPDRYSRAMTTAPSRCDRSVVRSWAVSSAVRRL